MCETRLLRVVPAGEGDRQESCWSQATEKREEEEAASQSFYRYIGRFPNVSPLGLMSSHLHQYCVTLYIPGAVNHPSCMRLYQLGLGTITPHFFTSTADPSSSILLKIFQGQPPHCHSIQAGQTRAERPVRGSFQSNEASSPFSFLNCE